MDDSAEILFQSFLQEALVSSSGMGRDVHSSFALSILHFLCRPRRRLGLKCPGDGFEEAVVTRDMTKPCELPTKPCELPSLDSCQNRFLWAHKEVDLAPHPVVGLVLQVGDAVS